LTTLIHHSPIGALQIAGVIGEIEPGEPFEVTEEHAATLLEQGDLYEVAESLPVGWSALTVRELRSELRDRGLATSGKHDVLAARLEEAEPFETRPQVVVDPEPTTADPTAPAAGDDTTQGDSE
jgi:hypothetical protein